jgi:DNA-directed RNA polymerase specialized sigma24 family protein
VSIDSAGFAEFYQATRDDCLRVVFASVGDRPTAEDLVAEAFARAWARWQTVSRHPAPAAWVVRTAFNARVSWWRRYRREVELPESGAETALLDGADGAVDRELGIAPGGDRRGDGGGGHRARPRRAAGRIG